MGKIKGLKAHAIVVQDGRNNPNKKSKDKYKMK
jgi:hypothetical protein